MIGEPVSREELEKLLSEEGLMYAKTKGLREELESIKPGECMLYRTMSGEEHLLALSLTLLGMKGLMIIKRPQGVYAYRREVRKEDVKEGKKKR